MKQSFSHDLKKVLILASVLAIAACSGQNIPDAKRTTGRDPQVGEVPSADETVRGDEDPPIVTLDLGANLHEHRLSSGEELPGNIIIPTTNLNAVPITTALQAVLAGTDVSLSWDTGSLGDRLVSVMNLSGPLPRVVNKICSAGKVFCTYRNGALELQEKDSFVVSLPPAAKTASGGGSSGSSSSSGSSGGASLSASSFSNSSSNSMVDAISQLAGTKVQVDEQGGNILYTTDVEGEEKVSRYLKELRNGRPLVVLQLYVWEVTLNKENSEGINWNNIKLSGLGPGFAKLALAGSTAFATAAGTSGSFSMGAVTTGRLNTSSLITFLSTQGRVQTISSPQITFVSGSSAEFKVGGKQRYISQVGQLVSSNNASGTNNGNANTGVGTNTVSTDSIDTGLLISVAGAYENGVVLANLDINLTNLVSLNPTNSGGGTIDLPQTTDEKITTVIRVRPGDNLVMAGLVTSSDQNTRQGIPLPGDGRIPQYGNDTLQNHELVVVVKPSVILFSDSQSTAEAKKREEASAKPLPNTAMLIDKDGSKSIAMPGAKPPLEITPVAIKPELMEATADVPTQAISVGASNDGAPVDRRMMQRGFSHAFDQLLQPAPTSLSGGGNNP